MRPKGTIYKFGKSSYSGEAVVSLPLHLRILYSFVRGMGAGLVGFFVIGFIFTFGPLISEETNYLINRDQKYEITNYVDIAEASRIIQVQKEADSYAINSHFSIAIPKINAASNILANVDVNNRKEYLESLKRAVAHAKGTYFPGQGENIVLFAHSTDSPTNLARYNAVFYLLRKLEPGDPIIVFFTDDKHIYEVIEKKVVEANDVAWINEKVGEERLVLLTCDPPGTTWRRLIIIAEPISEY